MEEQYFPPTTFPAFYDWFINFIKELEPIYRQLGIEESEFLSTKNDAAAYIYVHGRSVEYHAKNALFIDTRKTMLYGDKKRPALSLVDLPDQADIVETVPATVSPGIFARTRNLVSRLRQHPKMTDALARKLWIKSKPASSLKEEEFTPKVKTKVVNGKVVLDCPLYGFAGYEVWTDRNGGNDFILDKVSVGRFWTDETELPEGTNSQLRSYRVRMLVAANQPVGNFSKIVSETTVKAVKAG